VKNHPGKLLRSEMALRSEGIDETFFNWTFLQDLGIAESILEKNVILSLFTN
jgi:hypothetical protein